MTWTLIATATAGGLGWWARGRWLSAEIVTGRARIVCLEAELIEARKIVRVSREVYLQRLLTCGDCSTCTPPPAYLDYSQNVTTEES